MTRRTEGGGVALLALYLGVACACFGADTWYISNRLGMKLEAIPRYRADEFDYVLRLEDDGAKTVSTLTSRGGEKPAEGAGDLSSSDVSLPAGVEEVSRWERSVDAQGLVHELVFDHGRHASTGTYGPDGRLAREALFVDDVMTEDLSYRYAGSMLRSVESRSPTGELLWTTTYDVSRAGALRAVRRTGAEPSAAGFGFGGARLQEEYLESAAHTLVLRYDPKGRRVAWEVLEAGAVARATYSEYDLATGNLRREEDRAGADERTERSYDDEGRLVREVLTRLDKVVSTVDRSYDAKGRLAAAERRSDEGRELTTYGYGADGKLAWEEHRERGALRRRVVYTGESTRYEDLIQSDRLVLRVSYEGEEKVREEVIRDGKVLRSRGSGEGAP